MSSGIILLTILPKEQKFNGDNLLRWTTTMIQLLTSKGLLGYANGDIPIPILQEKTTITATLIYSTTPTLNE
jgi:hypothetical protein